MKDNTRIPNDSARVPGECAESPDVQHESRPSKGHLHHLEHANPLFRLAVGLPANVDDAA